MKTLMTVACLLLSFCASASSSCREFQTVHQLVSSINSQGVEKVLPRADWGDEIYRRKGQKQAAVLIGKTVVLVVLKRLTFMAYIFEPSRLGVSSMTGHYVSSPENFARFLELSPRQACLYLSMTDIHAQKLRDLTHEVFREMETYR